MRGGIAQLYEERLHWVIPLDDANGFIRQQIGSVSLFPDCGPVSLPIQSPAMNVIIVTYPPGQIAIEMIESPAVG